MSRSPEDHETDADDLIRVGTVASVDLEAARCTILLDDDSTTGPVRWLAPRMGLTKVWSPPAVGEQVVLLCPAGEVAGAVALGALVCEAQAAPSSERVDLIEFSDGAIVSYDPGAHALEITLPGGGTLSIVAPGGTTIESDVAITGDVTIEGELTASVDVTAAGISLTEHLHSGVQAGGSNTGAPV